MKLVMAERWAVVDGWPAYEVSDLGRIRRGGRLLKLAPVQSGRDPSYRPLYISLSDGKVIKKKVALLVLKAFRGPSYGRCVCHLDDDQRNNRLDNLRWGTAKANALDRVRNGLSAPGQRNGNSKLTEAKVRLMRAKYRRRRSDANLKFLAREFGVSLNAVWGVINRKTWSHVQ